MRVHRSNHSRLFIWQCLSAQNWPGFNGRSPRVIPTSLTWANPTQGGVDFSYDIDGPTLADPVTVNFYWANGPEYPNDIIGTKPAYSTQIPAGQSEKSTAYGPINVPGGYLQGAPSGSTNLLVVTDPDDTLGDFDPTLNSVSLTLLLDVSPVSQGNGNWAGVVIGHSTTKTIGSSGCALTSLVMALDYAGVQTDPLALDTLLTASTNGYVGTASLNWGPATNIAAANAGQPDIEWNPVTTTDPQALRDLLVLTADPIIVHVFNPHPADANHSQPYYTDHFVLVTGIDGNTFYVNDPGYAGRTTLDAYDNDFETRGYVSDPADVSALYVASSGGSDLALSVANPNGLVTGLTASGQPALDQIPGGVYFSDGSVEDLDDTSDTDDSVATFVYVPQPAGGTYQIAEDGSASSARCSTTSILPGGGMDQDQVTTVPPTAGGAALYPVTLDPSVYGAPHVSISGATAPRGHSGVTAFDFTVSLSSQPSTSATVNYATADGTATVANNDYEPTSGTLTFSPGGPLTQTVQVLVDGNTNDEPDETFDVNLSGAVNAYIVQSQGVGTIQDDSTAISIDDVSEYGANSGTTSFAFTVSLAHASTLPVSVDYATADGTATLANGEYQAQAGTLTFNPGRDHQDLHDPRERRLAAPRERDVLMSTWRIPSTASLRPTERRGWVRSSAIRAGRATTSTTPSTVGDVFCTTPGNNSNDGKTPATPVASLPGLLSLYTFHPGDTIYVDTGAYDLVRNLTLGPQFSDVRIVGPGPRQVTPSLDGSAVLADGPVAFWRLGDAGGTTAVDATGHGYNGTYVGGVSPLASGPSNDGAAEFDGQGGHVSVPDAPALNPKQFSIEAWVNYQDHPGLIQQAIVKVGNYILWYLGGEIRFSTYNSVSPPTAALPVGVWTHVVATFDGNNTARLYFNGRLVDGPKVTGAFQSTGEPLEIGSSLYPGYTTWKGGIDEVALYDKVLTPEQIQAHYAQAIYTGAVLDRGNSSPGNYGIELAGATDVSISGLTITGGAAGIYAGPSAGSRGLTVFNADLYGNVMGVDLEASNDGANLVDSSVHGSTQDGVFIAAASPVIMGNTVYGNQEHGIATQGPHPTVSDNVVYENSNTGVYVVSGVHGLISGNDVYANGSGGVFAANTGGHGGGERPACRDRQPNPRQRL